MHERINAAGRRMGMVSALLLAGLLLWGCYPKPIGPADPQGRRMTWEEMDLAQRQAHMRAQIVPRAQAIFSNWQPERFARIDCSLCHGSNAAAGIYNMPTAYLPRLSGELLLGPEFKQFPDTTRLKLDRLVPEMSQALGLKPFSLITRTGFGCYSCHLGPTGPMFGN